MKAVPGTGKRRRGVRKTQYPNVVTVQFDAFRDAVQRQVVALGIDWNEFLRQGRSGRFTDDRVRTLWNMVGHDLG